MSIITETEKRYIITHRAQGESFSKIAAALSRSESTVRSFYKRRQDTEDVLRPEVGRLVTCKNCGREFVKTEKSAKRQFCSAKCRNDWCNRQKREVPYNLICEHCGRTFTSFGNPRRRFCCRKCYENHRKTNNQQLPDITAGKGGAM